MGFSNKINLCLTLNIFDLVVLIQICRCYFQKNRKKCISESTPRIRLVDCCSPNFAFLWDDEVLFHWQMFYIDGMVNAVNSHVYMDLLNFSLLAGILFKLKGEDEVSFSRTQAS